MTGAGDVEKRVDLGCLRAELTGLADVMLEGRSKRNRE